jgi:hypothetical protein
MTERERLEREIYELTVTIGPDVDALRSKTTSVSDGAGLQRQIEIRAAERKRLHLLLADLERYQVGTSKTH